MIIGIGIDLVEVERVREMLARHPARGPARLFAEGEVGYCDGSRSRHESLAARYAAREALFKALGTGLTHGCSCATWKSASGETGAPGVRLTGVTRRLADEMGIVKVHLSLTHTGALAGAYVVLEGEGMVGSNELRGS